MRLIVLALTLILSLPISLFFSNCSSNSPDSEVTSAELTNPKSLKAYSQNKLDLDWAEIQKTAEKGGQNLLLQKISMAMKQTDKVLPKGVALVLTVNNHCESLQSSTLFSWSDQSFALPELLEQAYPAKVPRDIPLSDLQLMIENDPCIIGLSNDALLSTSSYSDPLYPTHLQLQAIAHPALSALTDNPTLGIKNSVIVAVIDSGIDYLHPDLKNKLWRGPSNEVGYDFHNGDGDPRDDFGHGTAVAGLIAAEANNGVGSAGVLTKNVKIMSLKVQDQAGDGYVSNVVLAIDYARARYADVINMSMSGPGSNESLRSALLRAVSSNIFVAVAAGNENQLVSTTNSHIPAIYGAQINGVMTVGSVASNNIYTRSSFSNYSPQFIEIMAPGEGGIHYPLLNSSSYASGKGTSYSTPIVAGAAAAAIGFFKSHNIAYTAGEIEALLNVTALKAGSLSNFAREGQVLHFGKLSHYLSTSYLGHYSGGVDEY